MILELHFEGPGESFKNLVSFQHRFSLLAEDLLADVVRSVTTRWASGGTRLLHARVEFSIDEWRAWSGSSEYKLQFTQFVAERTGRAVGLPRALSEYLGCDDVSCGSPRISLEPERGSRNPHTASPLLRTSSTEKGEPPG